MLTTVSKAVSVLTLFSPGRPVWGATAVASELGLKKSTAHDLLGTLAQLGLLHRTPQGQYTAGLRLLALAHNAEARFPWLQETRREMLALSQLTGETVHLSALGGRQLLQLDQVEGQQAVRVVMPADVPPQCSAMGKVLLAARPAAELERFVAAGLSGLTPNSITTRDELDTELARVREQGHAFDVEEVCEGVCCIAVPVSGGPLSGGRSEVIASVSLTAPSYRFFPRKEELRRAVLATGQRLNRALGGQA